MITNLTKFVAVGACALIVAGCQSTQTVETATEEPRRVEPRQERRTGPAPGSQEDFEQTAGHRVFYGFDQYNLTPQAQATLRRQAQWLQQYPNTRVRVSGNCDERGTREYNLALGARRASAAKDYLVGLGIQPSRIDTISYGKERPIDPRSTEEAWALNRNATTVLVGAGS